jgi:hypothetical protein
VLDVGALIDPDHVPGAGVGQQRVADRVDQPQPGRSGRSADLPDPVDAQHLDRGHCQSKFYTPCLRIRAGQSSTVFAHESPTRSAGFDAENGLYLFALTVPLQAFPQSGNDDRRHRTHASDQKGSVQTREAWH